MERRQWGPRAAGGAAFATALTVAVLPVASPSAPHTDAKPTFPSRVAGYSYLTGDVASSPSGRAVALFQHGFGVEFLDPPQAVVIGAGGDSYRRVGVAEQRHGGETQGDPGPMLLSPDGAHVAVGHHDTTSPDVALVDLATGQTRYLPVPGGRSVIPLAWSADSKQLAYISAAEPTNPYTGVANSSPVGILEPTSGQARLLPGLRAQAIAFSPTGSELAVQAEASGDPVEQAPARPGAGTKGAATKVEIVGLDGRTHRSLTLPLGHSLDGPNAWSPDGALIATRNDAWSCQQLDGDYDEAKVQACEERREATAFVDASGGGASTPTPLQGGVAGSHGVLGWTAEREVLVLDDLPAPIDSMDDSKSVRAEDTDGRWLTAVSLEGSAARRVSAVPFDDNYGIGTFQVASTLLPGLTVREAGEVDRGRWPTMLRVGLAALFAGAVLLVTKRVVSVRASR
ncbi:MAG: hypothetical protein L0H96_20800 [Humibacillus sp.]|nr:hypothetical protein [Humibacillus sp.]MDN5779336.1 hypothetical protein [Humibacillus sp.]